MANVFYLLAVIGFLLGRESYAGHHDEVCGSNNNFFSESGEERKEKVTVRMPECSVTSMTLVEGGYAERVVVNSSEDIFVSIKTTHKYHEIRLPPLVLTWLQAVSPEQVGVAFLHVWSPH